MTTEQYERVMLNALLQSPGLAECSNESLDLAVMHCIQAGLLPDGKQAAIIPFNSKQGKIATLVPMIEGRIMLARRATPGLTLASRNWFTRMTSGNMRRGLHPVLRHTYLLQLATAPMPAYHSRLCDGPTSLAVLEPEFEVLFQRGDIDRFKVV